MCLFTSLPPKRRPSCGMLRNCKGWLHMFWTLWTLSFLLRRNEKGSSWNTWQYSNLRKSFPCRRSCKCCISMENQLWPFLLAMIMMVVSWLNDHDHDHDAMSRLHVCCTRFLLQQRAWRGTCCICLHCSLRCSGYAVDEGGSKLFRLKSAKSLSVLTIQGWLSLFWWQDCTTSPWIRL